MVQQAVEQGHGRGLVGQEPPPVLKGPVAGDGERPAFVSGGHKAEQQLRASVVERGEAELVDHDHVGTQDLFDDPANRVVGQAPVEGLLPNGLQHYWKASFAKELSDGAAKVHAEYGAKVPSIQTAVHLYPISGAVQRVSAEETAFAYRDIGFSPVIEGMWDNPVNNEANIAWVRAYHEALQPHSVQGGYVNFMDNDDQGRIEDNYRGNYARLAAIKAKYDPDNVFHVNQNIKPAS